MNKKLFYIRTVQLLISDLGGIVTPILSFGASAALTWATFKVGHAVPGLSDQITALNQSTVAASLATFLTGTINYFLNSVLKREAYELQKMLIAHGKDVTVDGWFGEDSKRALHEVLAERADHRIDEIIDGDPNSVHQSGEH